MKRRQFIRNMGGIMVPAFIPIERLDKLYFPPKKELVWSASEEVKLEYAIMYNDQGKILPFWCKLVNGEWVEWEPSAT